MGDVKKYILGNPVIWILCVSNVFVYIVRIGIDDLTRYIYTAFTA